MVSHTFLTHSLFSLVALIAFLYLREEVSTLASERDLFASDQTSTDSILRVPLATKDVVYNPNDGLLYASLPSSAGSNGNSISRIDPLNGNVIGSVYVGSEPGKLALSSDGQALYTLLDGAYSVRRYDVNTQTAGLQFPLGTSLNPLWATDIAVVPGNRDRLAVSLAYAYSSGSPGVALFDNGVRLPQVGVSSLSSEYISFSSSPNTLYAGGYYGGLKTFSVSDSGVTDISGQPTSFFVKDIAFEGGLIFDSLGHVIEPQTKALLGTCTGIGTGTGQFSAEIPFVVDVASGRVFFATREGYRDIAIKAFDIHTFTQLGSLTISSTESVLSPRSLVRYGTNGIAMRVDDDKLYLIQTSLIPTPNPLPTPVVTPSISPTPTPTPFPAIIRRVELRNKDLAVNEVEQKIYVSVPASAQAPLGNTVTRVNPVNGAIEASIAVGNNPGRIALADDNRTLYVGMDGTNSIRRIDTVAQTLGIDFPLGSGPFGPRAVFDMNTIPGDPNAVAVTYGGNIWTTDGVDIFDGGVRRPQRGAGAAYLSTPSAGVLFSGEGQVQKFAISSTGLSPQQLISAPGIGKFSVVADVLYLPGGQAIDVNTGAVKGTFRGVGLGSQGAITVDLANNRIFFIDMESGNSNPEWYIKAFRLDNYLPIGKIALPSLITSSKRRLLRWGQNGLAFNDANERIFLVQSDLVSEGFPIPSVVQIFQAPQSVLESSGSVSVLVSRTGGLNSIATVDFATQSGTAVSGTDFVGQSGTITFAPGEALKTIEIPIINDLITEVPETFQFSLSNPGESTTELGSSVSSLFTIQDDETTPSVSIQSLTVLEPLGFGTMTNAPVVVRLSNPSSQTISMTYATANGSAIAGSDYLATTGSLVFAPLETTKIVDVAILGDNDPNEGVETFLVFVSNAVNVTFGTSGVISIVNNNPVPPTPTPTPTPSPTRTPTPTPTASPTPIITPTPNPTATPTASPTPTATPVFVRMVDLPVNDLIYNSGSGALYASVPSWAQSPRGNSITRIDPVNGVLGTSIYVGSEPNKLVISDDSTVIHVQLDGAKSIRQFNVSSETAGLQFTPRPDFAFFQDWAVVPGNPRAIALAGSNGVGIYDNGVLRPDVSEGGADNIASLVAASPSVLFGYDGTADTKLVRFAVNGNGVSGSVVARDVFGFYETLEYFFEGLIYSSNGRVADAQTGALIRTLNVTGRMTIDPTLRRIYFLTGNSLVVYSVDNFALIGSVSLPEIIGPRTIVRWGENGIATRDQQNRLFLIQSPLISSNGVVPSGIRFSQTAYSGSEGGILSVQLVRSGDLTRTSTIEYGTTPGTATPGLDYTAVTGTVTFSPGQSVKTITVPILSDTVYEGAELFGIILNNPSDPLTVIQSTSTVPVTITDAQGQPSILGGNLFVNEPQTGMTELIFNVRLSNASTQTVTVQYFTSNITAEAGSDYLFAAGTLTFAPLETFKTVTVQILGDEDYLEINESLRLNFTNPVNLAFSNPLNATIQNYRPAVGVGVGLSGRVTTPQGANLRNVVVILTDEFGNRTTATTSSFGVYNFNGVITGRNYVLSVASKRYRFSPKQIQVAGPLSAINFTGLE